MLAEYLEGNIRFLPSVDSWEEGIKKAADPLLHNGSITPQYIEDMIGNVNTNGPYIVIVPGIAMPHAKNDGSVVKTSVSYLKLEEPVKFPKDKEVHTFFVLAAEDSTGHLDLISDLSSILIEDEIKNKLEESKSEQEILEVLKMVE
ncbi:PTS ascorbate transporter subunit IIA [Halobacillus andaensis]|uniref:Ascorbate-specific PTS system EIIA component n=1 Tax=Halobacillus andaensis TaxID=1176239 RepID=A0A917B6Q0_HALAA|nr:PTS sugar transporter subunit IIA [Halobacillus andaensis]MBP2006512.1 PTS system mannitol-specific IIA component/PTS system ascorbate-specific IIA component [Halobacillus andaensis]GGF27961.1 PTS ascorbate transporter subunit IIA [Halobacillus andaensis]